MTDAIGMSPDTHLGLALNMLEHLPTTPAGLSFTSRIPLLMAHTTEVLTYQGEGIECKATPLPLQSGCYPQVHNTLSQLAGMSHVNHLLKRHP